MNLFPKELFQTLCTNINYFKKREYKWQVAIVRLTKIETKSTLPCMMEQKRRNTILWHSRKFMSLNTHSTSNYSFFISSYKGICFLQSRLACVATLFPMKHHTHAEFHLEHEYHMLPKIFTYFFNVYSLWLILLDLLDQE